MSKEVRFRGDRQNRIYLMFWTKISWVVDILSVLTPHLIFAMMVSDVCEIFFRMFDSV